METITPYLSQEQILKKVKELADTLAKERTIEAVVVLDGALPFYKALEKELHARRVHVTPHFIKVKSYQGTESTETMRLAQDVDGVQGKHLWIIEDIIDTGYTINFVVGHLQQKGAASVKICTLFHKKVKTKVPIAPDLVGFEVSDAFLVGFGLDYDGRHRKLPYVGVLKQ